MTEPALDGLIEQVSQSLDELREHRRSQQRGGGRIRARGAGAKDRLTTADRFLATVLYLRKLGTRDPVGQLFGVNGSSITRTVHQVQRLIAENGHTIPPSTARFRTPAGVTAFISSSRPTKIHTTC
ncbi:Helix-turn-helix of DDE superfamily endonuclease [Streptomyces sp. MnatMP-M77]|nr:Helix-turn-helix of DDE superfamily endonuclease [Streptomyces sp. MnatMP-M77]